MTRRILREIQLDKIAAVDFPCQEHALVTIMKRDPDVGKIRKTHLADRIFEHLSSMKLKVKKAKDARGHGSDSRGGSRLQVDTVTGPSHWASALINGDHSGMDSKEMSAMKAWNEKHGGSVVSIADGEDGNPQEPRFTRHYSLHGGTAEGGDVVDYVVHRMAKAKDARGHGSDARGGKRSTTESVFDHHMHMIARDTVRNPLKGTFLGGPSAEEAEHTLRNKFGYGDKDVARLKGTSPEEESYNRELRVRLHNVGPNGRLPPSTIKRIGQFQQRVQKLQEMVASV